MKYKRITERIKDKFIGFYIDEEDEGCPYIDVEKTDKEILNKRYFGIDSFPKQMEMKSPHGFLDVFWDLEKDKTRYLRQEDKFLRALLIIMSYSKDMIILNEYYTSEYKKYINKMLGKEDASHLKGVKDVLFDFKEIDYNYNTLGVLVKTALRERTNMNVYMLDLEIALEFNSLYSNVFLGVNTDMDFVRYICNVEGLYIRDRYLED